MRRVVLYSCRAGVIVVVFAVGFILAMFVSQHREHRDLVERLGSDLARLSEISERLAAGDTNGTRGLVQKEVAWRDDVLRGLYQQDEGLFDSILPTLQLTKRNLRYQGDPAFARVLNWAPSAPADDARHAFEQQFLIPRQTAPELSVSGWVGKAYALGELRGKVVLLDFWATSCGPCVAGMPAIQALGAEYEDRGLVVLTIHAAGLREHVEGFVRAKSWGLPVAVDTGRTFEDYGVHALPTKVLIDQPA